MNLIDMNKYFIIIAVLILIVVAGVGYSSFVARDEDKGIETGRVRELTVVARQDSWLFDPEYIEVDQGDRLILTVVNEDSYDHGFAIDAFGITQRLPANDTIRIEFVVTRPGDFPFYCSVPCGSGEVDGVTRGHFDQIGRLHVKSLVGEPTSNGGLPPALPEPIDGEYPQTAPSATVVFRPCDLDRDQDCDADDLTLFNSVFGQCEDDNNYNEPADADHDGCITEADREILFPDIRQQISATQSAAAISTANAHASALGYTPERLRPTFDRGNARWLAYHSSIGEVYFNDAQYAFLADAQNYFTVYYSASGKLQGADLWIFLDREGGEVLGYIEEI
jgi:plastocyanin